MKTGAKSLKARVATIGIAAASIVGGGATFAALEGGANAAPQTGHATNTSGSVYQELTPQRVADTRPDSGFGDQGQTLGPQSSITVAMPNTVPSNATAVVLNVTATDATQDSYFSVYPSGTTNPQSSNINIYPGLTSPNLVIVPLGSNNSINVFNLSGTVDAVVDLEGYFEPASAVTNGQGQYFPLVPNRITDTRTDSGWPNAGQTMGPRSILNVQVLNTGGVPSSGVSAVELNVTVTNTTTSGFMSVYPTGSSPITSPPQFSNLNWLAGETICNRVIVPVGVGGKISLYNFGGDADAVVDVDGYFSDSSVSIGAGDIYQPVNPARIADTRAGSGFQNAGNAITQNTSELFQVTGQGGVPTQSTTEPITAAVLNVTAATATEPSYLTVYPADKGQPYASDLNFFQNFIVANSDIADLSASGAIDIYNFAGTTNVAVDVFGYFTPETVTPVNTVTITPPSPTTPANGTSTIELTATVTSPTNNSPVSGDTVTFATQQNTASCGSLSAVSGMGETLASNGTISGPTASNGQIVIDYTPSSTVGTCLVEALESDTSGSAGVTVTQTAPGTGYTTTVTSSPASLPADGTSMATVSATVLDNGSPVNGDNVTFSGTALESGACGTIPSAAVSTNTNGVASFTYTATTTVGTCDITAQEAHSSGEYALMQTATGDIVSISPATATLAGEASEPLTVTVTNGGTPVANDTVVMSVPVVTCGQLSETANGLTTANGEITLTTNSSGIGEIAGSGVTYTASNVDATCEIHAVEESTSATGNASVTQSSVGNLVQVFAYPNTLAADGTSQSTVIATVTNDGILAGSGTVSFSGTTATPGACGVTSATPETMTNGQATLPYTATTTGGACTISATEGTSTGTVTIAQLGSAPSAKTLTLTPSSSTALLVLGTQVQITAQLIGTNGAPLPNTALAFTTSSSGLLPACGTLSQSSGITGENGEVTITYTAPLVAPVIGTCTITGTVTDDSSVTGSTGIEEIIPVTL